MVEIKMIVNNIDYSGIAELVMPIVKDKLSENDNGIGKLIGKHVPEAALNGAINGFLKFLTPEQKDEIAFSLVSKYQDKIVDIIQSTASGKGVNLTVQELSVKRLDED